MGGQYDPYHREWQQGLVALHWLPQRLTALSLSYRYQRDPWVRDAGQNLQYQSQGQNQLSVAFQWPFGQRWFGVGRVDYSFHRGLVGGALTRDTRRITQAILGLEYKGECCWTGRMVFQRYAIAAQDVNNAVLFQLELKGLGSLGTNLASVLSQAIPGYQPVTEPVVAGTPFERYE
jgi:LPS-assembly protein